ncbi:CheY-like chemotaxis protein [Sagittula marina]|uniref:CheY-like chemotaxis protein n=1 Tax=Sagittula marina TaxID=943940 RepID=A0A7W6DN86_9RHOB|nr:response regulator [Sagittula marina]MBB3986256.1 CheY-like chemotaxis protein [Sagittula marina]
MNKVWSEKELKALTILLLEDDDGEAKAVLRAFRSSRILNEVVRVTDGISALEELRKRQQAGDENPIVALVDINMPRMNGHEFVEAIRADPELHDLTMFMLTTSGGTEDIQRAYAQNVAGYVVKERAGEDFIHLVSTLETYWRVVEFPRVSKWRGNRKAT